MPLQTLDSFTFNHKDQVDKLYETKTATQVKEAFDSRGEDLQTKFNSAINTLKSTTVGDSGAENIGSSPITGLTGNTVQAVLESLKALDDTNRQYLLSQIQNIVLGQIPDGSITDIKLSDDEGQIKQRFTSHEADYMYQIPVISGTQIRINKLSNTNRLFFKLDADLTGGAITISTDGGTTSKPLQDISGTAITNLEKGFVEVVADATFFTLRNKGISATQKQQLIDIANAAEANQSTIKTNIANALNSKIGTSLTSANAWTDIINTIPSANAKKFASGSGTTGTTYYTITDSSGSGTSTNAWLLTVNGLSFKPSKVIIFHPTNRWLSVYNADDSYVGNGTNVVYIKLSGVGCYFGTFPQTNIQVVNGGFTLPVATAGDVSGGLSCKWYAYE